MEHFLINITSYPTVIYTTLLLIILLFWLLTVVGLFDMDILDVDIDLDTSEVGGALGVLVTLGLTGVPVTLVLSILILYSWTLCSILSLFIGHFDWDYGVLTFFLNTFILIATGALSIPLTAKTINPLRPLFRAFNQGPIQETLMGKEARVRTTKIDENSGQIECSRDGASLILNARSGSAKQYLYGETVIIIDFKEIDNMYIVVSKQEFNQ